MQCQRIQKLLCEQQKSMQLFKKEIDKDCIKVKKLAEFSEFHVERKRNYESRKAEINDRKDVLNIFDCDAWILKYMNWFSD